MAWPASRSLDNGAGWPSNPALTNESPRGHRLHCSGAFFAVV